MRQLGHEQCSKRLSVVVPGPLPCRELFEQPETRRPRQRGLNASKRRLYTHGDPRDRVLRRCGPEQQPALSQLHQQSVPNYAKLFSIPSDTNQDDGIHVSTTAPQPREAELDNDGCMAVDVAGSAQLDQADGAADQEPVSTAAESSSQNGTCFSCCWILDAPKDSCSVECTLESGKVYSHKKQYYLGHL